MPHTMQQDNNRTSHTMQQDNNRPRHTVQQENCNKYYMYVDHLLFLQRRVILFIIICENCYYCAFLLSLTVTKRN